MGICEDNQKRILSKLPDLIAENDGHNAHLIFDKDVAVLMKETSATEYYDSHAIILFKAATIVRQELFDIKLCFNGTFKYNCLAEAVS